MKEDHRYYRENIERSKQRLADLEERGIAAMSRYDIEIAHGGDAQGALDTAKLLVGNHIIYDSRKLDELEPEVRQMDLFGGLAPVADIFDANLVDDEDGEGMGRRTRSRTNEHS